MKKILLISSFCLFAFCSKLAAQDISGFWKKVGKDGQTRCVVAVYEYQNKYYGQIIATYDKKGQMSETIYKPKGRAPGVKGNPFYCGMDFIWDLQHKGSRYKGRILDPQRGKVYQSELWVKDGNLIVRGEILFFGRNEEWFPVKDTDFPSDFIKPDLKKLIPIIPQVK
ncbi:MAG TPA: DUF2147 domain-containing protein [Rhabdochlamydiaceae bacterium]|nr:DUF2147 domain-containing protein [Rhabdochlamydiaceae bacterium]